MKLEGSQRRQLHQALMRAFRKQETLKQELNFRLNVRLGEIANSQDFADTVFEVIDWAEAQGRLPELIDAACAYSPRNPELRDFVEQVWKPLQAQERSTISPGEQSDSFPAMPDTYVQAPAREVHKADPQKKHTRRASASKQKAPDAHRGEEPLPPSQSSQDAARQTRKSIGEFLLSAHNHVAIARTAIQTVIDLLQPEKDVFRDQCQLASLKVQEAATHVEKIATELSRVASTHSAPRYRLGSEQVYFSKEAGEVVVLLHHFSGQTESISQRKAIWDKLQKLIKSLQEIDTFIKNFGKHVVKHEANI